MISETMRSYQWVPTDFKRSNVDIPETRTEPMSEREGFDAWLKSSKDFKLKCTEFSIVL